MSTHARNLPDGAGNPDPPLLPVPPPPAPRPDVAALETAMLLAERAARQANAVYAALELDPAASFDATYRAWDVAHAALRDAYQTAQAYRIAVKWQNVRAA